MFPSLYFVYQSSSIFLCGLALFSVINAQVLSKSSLFPAVNHSDNAPRPTVRVRPGNGIFTSFGALAVCNGARFGSGGKLNIKTCTDAFELIPDIKSVDAHISYRDRPGTWDIRLPQRYVDDTQGCAIDISLSPPSMEDTIDPSILSEEVVNIIEECMSGLARRDPVGGRVRGIGTSKSLAVTLSAPREYNVMCSSLASFRTPLSYCQKALDLVPYGDEELIFGPATISEVEVSLPRRYSILSGRCAIQIEYEKTSDVVSWNEINNAVAVIFTKCLRGTSELGSVDRLGRSKNIIVRVIEEGAPAPIETA